MKPKFLAAVSLSAIALLGGCKSANTNTANTAAYNTNTNATAMMTPAPTPVVQTNESSATSPALKTQIESALKAKGFTTVTVDTTTTPATLRGTYPKGKLSEVIQTAQVANGGKPLQNQATEAK